jgi:uncharacterized protein involved in exopolysaccharide biosynthesis
MDQPQDDRTRIERLEQIVRDHDSRMALLEDLMARVITLTDIVTQLLQRRQDDTDTNGTV